jgi:hypothetical protein
VAANGSVWLRVHEFASAQEMQSKRPGVLTKLETALSDRQRDEQDRKTLPLSHRLIAEIPVTNIVAAQSMPIPGMQ